MSDELPLIVSDGRWGCGGMRSQCMWSDTFTAERIEIDTEIAARIREKLKTIDDAISARDDNQSPDTLADLKKTMDEMYKDAFDK